MGDLRWFGDSLDTQPLALGIYEISWGATFFLACRYFVYGFFYYIFSYWGFFFHSWVRGRESVLWLV